MTRCAGYERHLGLRYFIASSPQTTGRIVFVNLRTGNSLSVALHLPSQERSYFQLMGPNQTHEGTCTLLFRRLRRRTTTDFQSVVRGSHGLEVRRTSRRANAITPSLTRQRRICNANAVNSSPVKLQSSSPAINPLRLRSSPSVPLGLRILRPVYKSNRAS